MELDRQRASRTTAGAANARRGIVWVARRIPDGYVSGHANQARIATFPLDDPENCLYAPDVVSFAREMGYYEAPRRRIQLLRRLRAARNSARCAAAKPACGLFFRTVADGMERSRGLRPGPQRRRPPAPVGEAPHEGVAQERLRRHARPLRGHAPGHDRRHRRRRPRLPLPLASHDLRGGRHGVPTNERATATQQTGFWFVAQAPLPWVEPRTWASCGSAWTTPPPSCLTRRSTAPRPRCPSASARATARCSNTRPRRPSGSSTA